MSEGNSNEQCSFGIKKIVDCKIDEVRIIICYLFSLLLILNHLIFVFKRGCIKNIVEIFVYYVKLKGLW